MILLFFFDLTASLAFCFILFHLFHAFGSWGHPGLVHGFSSVAFGFRVSLATGCLVWWCFLRYTGSCFSVHLRSSLGTCVCIVRSRESFQVLVSDWFSGRSSR